MTSWGRDLFPLCHRRIVDGGNALTVCGRSSQGKSIEVVRVKLMIAQVFMQIFDLIELSSSAEAQQSYCKWFAESVQIRRRLIESPRVDDETQEKQIKVDSRCILCNNKSIHCYLLSLSAITAMWNWFKAPQRGENWKGQ